MTPRSERRSSINSNSPRRSPRRAAGVFSFLALGALLTPMLASPALAQGRGDDDNRREGAQRGPGGERGGGFRGRGGGGERGGGFRGRGGGGGGGWGMFRPGDDLMRPEYDRRDLQLLEAFIPLEEEQRFIIEALLVDYEAAFGVAVEGVREQLDEVRADNEADEDPEAREARRQMFTEMRTMARTFRAVRRASNEELQLAPAELALFEDRFTTMREEMRQMRESRGERWRQQFEDGSRDARNLILEAWRAEREALGDRFITDLRNMLTPLQLEAFSSFEYAKRRSDALPQSRLSGEGVDLFLVANDVPLMADETERLSELFDAYAAALDAALITRDQFVADALTDFFTIMREGDVEKIESLIDQDSQNRTRIRDINEQYADAIAAGLEPDRAAAWNDSYRERAYPRIYQSNTQMRRTFAAVRELEGLDPDVLDAIAALEVGYESELAELNAIILLVTREAEPDQAKAWVNVMAQRMSGEGGDFQRPEDPIRDLYNDRSILESQYREQLEALLTPEQIEALPNFRNRARRGGNEGGDDNERRRGGRGFGETPGFGDRESPEFQSRQAAMLEAYDADGDGQVGPEERARALEVIRERFGVNQQIDEDGDNRGRRGRGPRGGDDN